MRHSHQMPGERVRADRGELNIWMLDRALASGAPVEASPDWLMRGRELCSPAERHELARALVIILQVAQHADANPVTRLDASSILHCGGRILALVSLLETSCEFRAQGLALAWLLLEEPDSPLFRAHPNRTLEQALNEITAAL